MADEKNLNGQSFDNQALTGSGSIARDGTLGPNRPDPTEVRGLSGERTSGGRLVGHPENENADYLKLNEESAKDAEETPVPAPTKRSTAK